jgi:hypothetical protein
VWWDLVLWVYVCFFLVSYYSNFTSLSELYIPCIRRIESKFSITQFCVYCTVCTYVLELFWWRVWQGISGDVDEGKKPCGANQAPLKLSQYYVLHKHWTLRACFDIYSCRELPKIVHLNSEAYSVLDREKRCFVHVLDLNIPGVSVSNTLDRGDG